jgi:hypothetical protein
MKKAKFMYVAIAILLSQFTLQAQSADYPNTVSFNAGYSFFNTAAKAAKLGGATASATPTLQGSFDHCFNEWLSLGGAVSYNGAKTSATNITIIDSLGMSKTGDYDAKISRITVSARLLFHFGNKGRMDMYSGFRLGAGIWNNTFTSTIPGLEASEVDGGDRLRNGTLPTIQLIPFGLRTYVTDNIGLGFETAIGSPYMAAFQLNYRLGGGKN